MKKMSSYLPGSQDDSEGQPGFADLVEKTFSRDVLDTVLAEKESHNESGLTVNLKTSKPTAPQRQLDLHGNTLSEAQRRTRHFLENCQHYGLLKVRIITGRGLHSAGEPVLPAGIALILAELQEKGEIHSFHWENHISHSGALIVIL